MGGGGGEKKKNISALEKGKKRSFPEKKGHPHLLTNWEGSLGTPKTH